MVLPEEQRGTTSKWIISDLFIIFIDTSYFLIGIFLYVTTCYSNVTLLIHCLTIFNAILFFLCLL